MSVWQLSFVAEFFPYRGAGDDTRGALFSVVVEEHGWLEAPPIEHGEAGRAEQRSGSDSPPAFTCVFDGRCLSHPYSTSTFHCWSFSLPRPSLRSTALCRFVTGFSCMGTKH